MLTLKLNPVKLSQNASNLGLGPKNTVDLKRLLASPNSPNAKARILALEKGQKDFINKKTLTGAYGWVNETIAGYDQRILVERGTGLAVLSLEGSPIIGFGHIQLPQVTFPVSKMVKILITPMHEDNKEFPYRDTTGNVTIGGGKKITDWQHFKRLHDDPTNDITFSYDGRMPTDADFQTAYNKIIAFNLGNNNMLADQFEHVTKLRISEKAGMKLAENHLKAEVLAHLNAKYPSYQSLPEDVQMAVADIVYNVGKGDFDAGWPKFKLALSYRDFETAAKESHRKDPRKGRNDWTKAQIKRGINSQNYFLTTDPSKRGQALQITGDLKGAIQVAAPASILIRF